jgi:hypothetical protein
VAHFARLAAHPNPKPVVAPGGKPTSKPMNGTMKAAPPASLQSTPSTRPPATPLTNAAAAPAEPRAPPPSSSHALYQTHAPRTTVEDELVACHAELFESEVRYFLLNLVLMT